MWWSTGGFYRCNRSNLDGRCCLNRRCRNHWGLWYHHWKVSDDLWYLRYCWTIETMSHRCGEANLATRCRWKWGENWRDLIDTNGWWVKIRCCIFSFVGVDDFESILIDFVDRNVHVAEDGPIVVRYVVFVVHDDDVDVRSDKLSLLGYWPPIAAMMKMMKTRAEMKK